MHYYIILASILSQKKTPTSQFAICRHTQFLAFICTAFLETSRINTPARTCSHQNNQQNRKVNNPCVNWDAEHQRRVFRRQRKLWCTQLFYLWLTEWVKQSNECSREFFTRESKYIWSCSRVLCGMLNEWVAGAGFCCSSNTVPYYTSLAILLSRSQSEKTHSYIHTVGRKSVCAIRALHNPATGQVFRWSWVSSRQSWEMSAPRRLPLALLHFLSSFNSSRLGAASLLQN